MGVSLVSGTEAGPPAALAGLRTPGVRSLAPTSAGALLVAQDAMGDLVAVRLDADGRESGRQRVVAGGTWYAVDARGDRGWASWRSGTQCWLQRLESGAPTGDAFGGTSGCYDPDVADVGTAVAQGFHGTGAARPMLRAFALDGTELGPARDVGEPVDDAQRVTLAASAREGAVWMGWVRSGGELVVRRVDAIGGELGAAAVYSPVGTIADYVLVATERDGVDVFWADDAGVSHARLCFP